MCCVQELFWMLETISVHNMFFPGLSLEFSCIELVIQWTIHMLSYCGLVDAKIRASDKDMPVFTGRKAQGVKRWNSCAAVKSIKLKSWDYNESWKR